MTTSALSVIPIACDDASGWDRITTLAVAPETAALRLREDGECPPCAFLYLGSMQSLARGYPRDGASEFSFLPSRERNKLEMRARGQTSSLFSDDVFRGEGYVYRYQALQGTQFRTPSSDEARDDFMRKYHALSPALRDVTCTAACGLRGYQDGAGADARFVTICPHVVRRAMVPSAVSVWSRQTQSWTPFVSFDELTRSAGGGHDSLSARDHAPLVLQFFEEGLRAPITAPSASRTGAARGYLVTPTTAMTPTTGVPVSSTAAEGVTTVIPLPGTGQVIRVTVSRPPPPPRLYGWIP
jgi:hypothetical protein